MLNLYSNTRKDGIFMNRRANSSYFHEAEKPWVGSLSCCGPEAKNAQLPKEHYILFRATHSEKTIGLKSQGTQRIIMSPIIA